MIKRKWLLILLTMALLGASLPGVPALAQGSRTFPETGKTVSGRFLDYWNNHGGLTQQGYPISEELQEQSDTDGKTYTVQYFERAVFEKHPENQAPNDVLLTLLGSSLYKEKYPNGAPGQQASADNQYTFSETGKTLGGKFRAYWESHGGLAQQGFPISNEFQEKSETDGKTYTVQYFERAVFELHPENAGTPNVATLSLLGKFRLARKGGATSGRASAAPTMPATGLLWTNVAVTTGNIALFYNYKTGAMATARIGADGTLTPLQKFPDAANGNLAADPGFYRVVAGPNNNVLFYSSETGLYAVIALDNTGKYTTLSKFKVATGWSIINIDPDTGVIIYLNPTNNTVAIDRMSSAGQVSALVAPGPSGAFSKTTHLVPTGAGFSNWVLYRQDTGYMAQLKVTPSTIAPAAEAQDVGKGWTHVVSDFAGHLVFYNNYNGSLQTAGVQPSGPATILRRYSGLSTDWYGLVGTSNHLLLYYDLLGNLQFDKIQADGSEVFVKKYAAWH